MKPAAISLALVAAACAATPALGWTGAGLVAGTWHGTAQSKADPAFTFPVQANVWLDAHGTPHGAVQLQAPLSCNGRWTATAQRGATTTFAETIVREMGPRCLRGGTVTLSPASGGRLRYVWTKGDLASFAYLEGVAGTWHGTVTEAGGTPLTMTATIRGDVRGGIEGSVGYGGGIRCSGRWTPTDAAPAPGWRHFVERITRSSSANCDGLGRVAVRLRADGGLQYHWTDGPYATNGVLQRAASAR